LWYVSESLSHVIAMGWQTTSLYFDSFVLHDITFQKTAAFLSLLFFQWSDTKSISFHSFSLLPATRELRTMHPDYFPKQLSRRRKDLVPPKRWWLHTNLNGVTSQKTAIFMKRAILWDVTPWFLVHVYRRFRLTLKMGEVSFLVTSVNFYQSRRHKISE
jgi:hypothetical protein